MQSNRERSVSTDRAIDRLRDAGLVISRRGGVKDVQLKRVREAASAVAGETSGTYEEFLRKVNDIAGPQMTLLSALGLGRTLVKGMKDRTRLDLPYEIKNHASTLGSDTLRTLAEYHIPAHSQNGSHPGQSGQEIEPEQGIQKEQTSDPGN
ncbi:hypothetical protein LTS17_001897 [Exophiala oligosperma]